MQCRSLYLEIYFNTVLLDLHFMSKTTQETREIVKSTIETPTKTSTTQHSANLQTATKFFDEMEKSVSQYRQSIEDYQQEFVRSCRNNFELIVSAQREFAEKSGTTFTLPEASEKIVNDTLESFSKAYSTQRQTSFAIIRAVTQNIKALNDNAESFAKLNRSISQLWIPNLSPKRD